MTEDDFILQFDGKGFIGRRSYDYGKQIDKI
jgi:hypothetical protein